MNFNRELDCVGFFCPLPVVKTKLELEEIEPGEILKVTADDPGSKEDFPAWCSETGHKLLKTEED
nr:sulfurtransferase TusA family protein [Elusimicrobiota bacterium]